MKTEDLAFLRSFFRVVTDQPIEFKASDTNRYVPLYDTPELAPHDPVKLLARPIQFALGQSVQLFSGFRGSGKSTELHRLRKYLSEQGDYKVVLCDIEDYINLSQSVDIIDFLLAVAGAFGDALQKEGFLPDDSSKEGYWERFTYFLKRTDLKVPEMSTVGIKVALKSDPSFRETLQKRMAGHLGALVEDVRTYVTGCVKKVKERHGPDTEVVLLLDSMEHIRGTSTNATAVQDSVVNLFTSHSDKLHFDHLHVVYTIPPYLKVLYPNLGTLYSPGGVQVLPALKVRDSERNIFQPGLDLLERLISARGDWQRLLGPERETLDRLSLLSGGHLRDFLRLFSEIIRRADRLPVPETTVDAAIAQVRTEFLPIADADAKWLHLIATTHGVALPDIKLLHDLARYLDTHLALYYRNGNEWYDVHPLVRDVVKAQAEEATRRQTQSH
ncbi:hypothetical protein CYFUS_007762 [Cystobacter fuscus]|uniref:Type II secretory pathway, ATPase PulE/Tfp pilus assembly pathway, ATPase PilB n=1 Tax=Cystobacter fuscus TaxID=43 RepID=A0A250JEF0_9BACT|nr:hypothetical protein [Cystobacter fuscus]ATB42284.1 hypothetical protein CYFUS_007762 [Cystobacter fuscus]